MLLFTLLNLFTLVAAKGGKGGGSSDSSGSSSGSDSSGSSSGSSSRPKGKQHVEISGAKWPYRWPGSYYNGSITLDTSIEYWPDCSEGSRSTFRTNYDGILMLGPGNQTGSFDDINPNFLIMGWDAGKPPTSNWTDGEYWGNGGPGLTRWFSTDVKLMLSRFIEIWQDSTSIYDQRTYDHGWGVDAAAMGNGTNEYSINGTWSGSAISFNPRDNSNNNFMRPVTAMCNNRSLVDQLVMNPNTWSSASKDWDTTQNTTFRGTFNDRRASITWSGNYWAAFNSLDYGVPGSKESFPQGYFNINFEGVIDEENSDRLVARVVPEGSTLARGIGGPDWIELIDEDVRTDDNQPEKRTYYTNGAGSARSRVSLCFSICLALAMMVLS